MIHLPAPKHGSKVQVEDVYDDEPEIISSKVLGDGQKHVKSSSVPPYGQRAKFLPRSIEDFEDGGAFPEIHVLQYPLNMGRPGHKSQALVTVDVDEQGQVRYDAIVRKQGANSKKIVRSSITDIKEGSAKADKVALPCEDEAEQTAARTQEALERLISGKMAKAAPTIKDMGAKEDTAQYIRYDANPDAPGYNPEVKQRVIKMVEAQVDPMEPPRHAVQKAVRGPGSPPVPVLHSPSRKLTKEEKEEWKIPTVISNWKNNRGFTIPLDKRIAADGRNLQEHTINNKFATLAEALYITERKAAEDLRVRANIRKQLAMKEKEEREAELREMASRARSEHTSSSSSSGRLTDYKSDSDGSDDNDEDARDGHTATRADPMEARETAGGVGSGGRGSGGRRKVSNLPAWMTDGTVAASASGTDTAAVPSPEKLDEGDAGGDDEEHGDVPAGGTEADEAARAVREQLRTDQRAKRVRELRDERRGKRKSKDDRDDGRDVSEKIALGTHRGATKLSGEGMFDSRLFNQSSGIGQGFGADDEYNQFDKPLFDRGNAAASIYKPTASSEEYSGASADAAISKLKDTSRFKADVGFAGAEGGGPSSTQTRTEPVQFEKAGDVASSSEGRQDDPFGLDAVMGGDKKRIRR